MKQSLLLLFFVTAFQVAFGQDNYDADLIPTTLRSRANAVIRNEETVVDMRSSNDVIYKVKQAITVLNKNGENSARLVIFYDKNTSIKSAKGEVYNETGALTGKFSQSDFKDESAVQDFSLFEDSRVKHYLPSVNTYPYTIVYTYEIRHKQNLIIPDWVPKPANDVAIEKSSYSFICKPTDQFRIQTLNLSSKAEELINEKQKMLTWKVSNVAANKSEPYSPDRETYLTSVKIAPQEFSYYNTKGNYSNWNELGSWTYNTLLKGRNTLPPATVATISDLVKGETSDKAKAKKIYEYLQQKTRYISVQIGIGGFQPVQAAEVDRLGYGDCKALVNYMQSLLMVANIESYYCVVEAGTQKKSLDPSFANMTQGNHIILCLPLKGDTTWLECTSQKIPFGFLSDFTDDRYVLACTETGGKLLRTPKLTTTENLQQRTGTLVISADGTVSGTLKTVFSGAQYENHEEAVGKPTIEQHKLLKDYYDVDNINFSQVSYKQNKAINPELTENLTFDIRNYTSTSGDKLFLPINIFNVKDNVPESKNRKLPLYLNRGYTDVDSLVYTLPDNVFPIMQTIETSFETEFGNYNAKTMIVGGKLVYVRKFSLNDGTFAAERYTAFSKFIADVNNADHLKIVLSLKQ